MFQVNQLAYIVVSNRIIQPVTILRTIDKKCLVRFERAGEMWIPENRLYENKEDAERSLQKVFKLEQPKVLTYIDKIRH